MSTTLPLRLSAGAVLLASLAPLAACGGPQGSEAPTDATLEDFCDVMSDMDVSSARKVSKALAEVGTPDGIPDDARKGFEYIIDNAADEDISADAQDQVTALMTWYAESCLGFEEPAS